jgi:hypothetical protein
MNERWMNGGERMRTVRALVAATAMLLSLVVSAPRAAAQASGGIVQGRVTDALTSETLPGATEFPDGLIVAMNSAPRTFLLARWKDVVARLSAAARRGTGEPAR